MIKLFILIFIIIIISCNKGSKKNLDLDLKLMLQQKFIENLNVQNTNISEEAIKISFVTNDIHFSQKSYLKLFYSNVIYNIELLQGQTIIFEINVLDENSEIIIAHIDTIDKNLTVYIKNRLKLNKFDKFVSEYILKNISPVAIMANDWHLEIFLELIREKEIFKYENFDSIPKTDLIQLIYSMSNYCEGTHNNNDYYRLLKIYQIMTTNKQNRVFNLDKDTYINEELTNIISFCDSLRYTNIELLKSIRKNYEKNIVYKLLNEQFNLQRIGQMDSLKIENR